MWTSCMRRQVVFPSVHVTQNIFGPCPTTVWSVIQPILVDWLLVFTNLVWVRAPVTRRGETAGIGQVSGGTSEHFVQAFPGGYSAPLASHPEQWAFSLPVVLGLLHRTCPQSCPELSESVLAKLDSVCCDELKDEGHSREEDVVILAGPSLEPHLVHSWSV